MKNPRLNRSFCGGTGGEKGFYRMAFALALFAAVAVQKNVRYLAMFKTEDERDTIVADGR